VVSVQFGCSKAARKVVDIWLNSIRDGVFEPPVAKFNKVTLPASFVQRINERMQIQRERNAAFYRSLFAPPIGTKGAQPKDSASQ